MTPDPFAVCATCSHMAYHHRPECTFRARWGMGVETSKRKREKCGCAKWKAS